MNNLIRWAVKNSPGMNTLMIALLLIGGFCLWSMRREEFPEFELERIVIAVPYPGASPEEVEEGICLKIEEAVRSVDGIKKQVTVASEGSGSVILELESSVKDVQRVLNEVRSEIDRIPSFPELAEDPEVEQITMRKPAIRLAVIGPESDDPDAELKLREVAERVRDDLLQLPTVTQANLMGTRAYQIDVEISEAQLRSHGLSLSRVADIIRRENLELPGGLLKAESGNILLRGRHKRLTGDEISKIPLVTREDGVVLTVADLGIVKDEFADTVSISRVDGKPGLVISVDKTSNEDLLTIVATVRKFAENEEMPAGYSLHPWKDAAIAVQDRMDLLARNGLQGLVLVFLMLAIFLEFRLAFWVSMGIPVSILGACAILLYMDQTLNMLSMFAFMMALGIVVDDAIVTGENIYAHREKGKPFTRAAIDGTIEVFPSVLGSILTSIIAFLPLMFVSGLMGKFIAVLPVTIIAMLAISLFESTFILPGHLAHEDSTFYRVIGFVLYPLKPVVWFFNWLNKHSGTLLNRFIELVYIKIVEFLFRFPAIVVSVALSVLILSFGFVQAGMIPFVIFPKLDKNDVRAKIVYQDGTPSAVTDAATKRLEQAIKNVISDKNYKSIHDDDRETEKDESSILKTIHRTVGSAEAGNPANAMPQGAGSHIGSVSLELVDTSERTIRSNQLLAEWREEAGDFPGADSIIFDSPNMGPGGVPIEFKLLAPSNAVSELEAAVEECKVRLAEYPGVYDIADDSAPGKVEFRIKIKERARAMGIPLFELADTVRASYFGAEVMRLQRGRHEVKLMVRYPDDERRSLANFDQIRVRGSDGANYPITELADIEIARGASEINRVDQLRSITVSSDLNEQVEGANAKEIVADLKTDFFSLPEQKSLFAKIKHFFFPPEDDSDSVVDSEESFAKKYPNVRVRWEGQEAESQDSIRSLMIGLALAMIGMYILLTIQFTSYLQPILIMMIIPFGCIGAIAGHFWLGLPVTMFSLFGLVALTGVVVNDSIVLIDFINQRMADGMPLHDAIIDAGRRRFRPVLLTSVTTVAGLTPILLETSLQAQFLIPMAASLSFGIMTSTILVLILVPSFYCILDILFKIGPRPASSPIPESATVEPAIVG